MVDGHISEAADVVLGVSQGTVLGPVFFLIFINDIASNIKSHIHLFADDCLLYTPVYEGNLSTYIQALQKDHNTPNRSNHKHIWVLKFKTLWICHHIIRALLLGQIDC